MRKYPLGLALLTVTIGTTAPSWAGKAKTPGRNKLTPALCEMLGMADEYISRFDYMTGKPRGNLVEHFYPHEKALAVHYGKLIAQYQKEGRTRAGAKRKADGSGHQDFYGKRLSRVINGFYHPISGTIVSLDRRKIMAASKTCRLRYIQGAYRRYHSKKQNVIKMANAGFKIETIGHVLKSLGCKEVTLLDTATIPAANLVFFLPSPKVAQTLPITKHLSKAAFAKLPNRKGYREL
ncbi:MAG: hypothetical protein KAI47_06820 [Deltaproteobacteria bacterium]|nr:hypothetical protein [Deltaproteobacteria bacterium]